MIYYFPLLYPHLNNSFLVSTLKVIKSHKRLYLRDVKYYSDFPSIIFFCFYSSSLLPCVSFLVSFFPSLPFFFLLSFLNFTNTEGQGRLSIDQSKEAASIPEANSPQTGGVCHMTGNSFPVAHQNPVLFLWNNVLHLFSLPWSRHESHPTKFLYICDILFSSLCKNSSSILYYLYFVHWCKGHNYFFFFPQPFSTYFFQRIMGCSFGYCFSSGVISDILCGIKFCEHSF